MPPNLALPHPLSPQSIGRLFCVIFGRQFRRRPPHPSFTIATCRLLLLFAGNVAMLKPLKQIILANAAHYAAASKTLYNIVACERSPSSADSLSNLLAQAQLAVPQIEEAQSAAAATRRAFPPLKQLSCARSPGCRIGRSVLGGFGIRPAIPQSCGVDVASFTAAGCEWSTIRTAGFSAAEAKAAGCDLAYAR